MNPTTPKPRTRWQREKFWAFVLLGLNRVLYQDFLPPWGFEFLVRVNAQAWWYYAQSGFDTRYDMPGQDGREQSPRDGDEEDVRVEDRCDDNPVLFNLAETPSQNETRYASEPGSSECSWSFSSGRQVHCSICCAGGCGDADLCYLQCSCGNEQSKAESLLPIFDWEDVVHGQDFDDLF